MNIIPIAFAFDSNLINPACICLSSLLMNAKKDTFYDIFIIHSENENLDRQKLDKLASFYNNFRITYRTIGSIFDDAFEIRGITTPAYYRLLIPEKIPEYEKIIYSDVDVIFQSDLSEIYLKTDLDGYYFGGVDSLSDLNPKLVEYYQKLGISAKGIIYSGNLIFNSKAILEDGIINQFLELSKNSYLFQDMDVINIACRGKIKYLSLAFCITTYLSEFKAKCPEYLSRHWSETEIINAFSNGIIHYNGQKPWKGVCINFDIWWEYYRKSPFYDEHFYFDFFNDRLNELDNLPLWKRIKILLRYFIKRK